jgi:hypothetical protein
MRKKGKTAPIIFGAVNGILAILRTESPHRLRAVPYTIFGSMRRRFLGKRRSPGR